VTTASIIPAAASAEGPAAAPVTDPHGGRIASSVNNAPEEPATSLVPDAHATIVIAATNPPEAPTASLVADVPETPTASLLTDAPEAPTTSLVADAHPEPIASSTTTHEEPAPPSGTDVPPALPPPPSAVVTALDALAQLSAATLTLSTASAPVTLSAQTALVPAEADREQENNQASMAVAAAHDSPMDVDNAQGGLETDPVMRSQPTLADFELWKGLAMQSLDSTASLDNDFNWLEYRQSWTPKRGAPTKEVRDRLELFGQRVALMVNALAEQYGLSQSVAWGYTNLLRKEVRALSDYNIYKAWRASKLRGENGGKSSKDPIAWHLIVLTFRRR
jgi:hypothetical protein